MTKKNTSYKSNRSLQMDIQEIIEWFKTAKPEPTEKEL
nr:MAG TPA: hypothetical protein [Caudoviricetes sp.]